MQSIPAWNLPQQSKNIHIQLVKTYGNDTIQIKHNYSDSVVEENCTDHFREGKNRIKERNIQDKKLDKTNTHIMNSVHYKKYCHKIFQT